MTQLENEENLRSCSTPIRTMTGDQKLYVLPLHHGTSFVHCVSVMRLRKVETISFTSKYFVGKDECFLGFVCLLASLSWSCYSVAFWLKMGRFQQAKGRRCRNSVVASEGKQMFLLSFFQILQGALDDVIALIDEAEIFVAIPEIVSDCDFKVKRRSLSVV